MSNENWVMILRWVSIIGLLLVFVSTVGKEIVQARLDKANDEKIDFLVNGNNELLGKVNKYQVDLNKKNEQIRSLELSARKAGCGVTSTYDFNGAKRETSAGQSVVTGGEELNTFQRMAALEKERKWQDLKLLCQEQIKKTPEWLTPYLMLGVAFANLGDKESAIVNLEHVISSAAGDPAYKQAQVLLSQLKGE